MTDRTAAHHTPAHPHAAATPAAGAAATLGYLQPGAEPGFDKEIKVRIPLPYHIKLHTIKVLHGQAISTTVREALDAYFRRFDARGSGGAQQRLEAWADAGEAAPAHRPGPLR